MGGFYGENKENDFTNDDEILNILEDYIKKLYQSKKLKNRIKKLDFFE